MEVQDRNKNIEKCISTLKDLRSEFEKIAKPRMQYKRIRWALTCAIEALGKQIPKKPKTEPFYGGRCIVCNALIPNKSVNYCHKCGQKIQWGD